MVKAVVPHKCSICKYSGHNLRTCEKNKNKKGSNFIRLFGVKIKNLDPNHGQPWSEQEHRLFLTRLQELGVGDSKSIAHHYVTTRTPRQVGTHAQKYYRRLKTPAELKIRRSIFDIRLEEPVVAVNGVNGPAEGHGPYPSSSPSTVIDPPIDEALDGSPSMTSLDLELRL